VSLSKQSDAARRQSRCAVQCGKLGRMQVVGREKAERRQSGLRAMRRQSVAPSRTSSQLETTPRRGKLCAHTHRRRPRNQATKPSQTLNGAYNCIESVSEQSRGSTASSCRVQPETQTSQLLSSTDFVLGSQIKKKKSCARNGVGWFGVSVRNFRQRSWSSEVKMAGDGKQLGGSAAGVAVEAKRRCTQTVTLCSAMWKTWAHAGGWTRKSGAPAISTSSLSSAMRRQDVAPSRTSSQLETTPRRGKLCAHTHTHTHSLTHTLTHGHQGTKPSQTLNRAYNCIESVSEQSRGSTASSCRVQPETQTSQLLSSTDFVLGSQKKKKEKLCEERSGVVWSECEERRQRSWSSEVKMASDDKQLSGSATGVAVEAKRRCTQTVTLCSAMWKTWAHAGRWTRKSGAPAIRTSSLSSAMRRQSVAPSRTSSQLETTPRRGKLCAHALTHSHTLYTWTPRNQAVADVESSV
jgi:hypothetical protein